MKSDIIKRSLEWAYKKALDGLPMLPTAYELADEYMKKQKSPYDQAREFKRWQVVKNSGNGFLTNLGGIITLPATLPANIASVLYVQVRMIATIAIIGGHNPREDKVKTLCFLCLLGTSAFDVTKDIGIQIGNKVAVNLINKISDETITKINQIVGFRLVTKFGQRGVLNISKWVPIIGGIIGGGIDGVTTNTIGNVAIKVFIDENN